MQKLFWILLFGAAVLAAACRPQSESPINKALPPQPAPRYAAVDAARLTAADDPANDGQWMSYGRDYAEQRFSPLKSINTDNVKNLGLAWYADFDTRRGQESTPLAIDGVIYVTTAWSKIYAFDAKTGRQLWKFDPKVPGEWAVNACCDVVNRGVAAWQGKLYIGTIDGRLIAVDAATGKSVWDVYTAPRGERYAITGAPRVVKGLVLIGNGARNSAFAASSQPTTRRPESWSGAGTRCPAVRTSPTRTPRWKWPPRPGAPTP